MKVAIAFLLGLLCSVSAAKEETSIYVKEVPHSERSEVLFYYFQKHEPSSTANPFNGTQQEHKA